MENISVLQCLGFYHEHNLLIYNLINQNGCIIYSLFNRGNGLMGIEMYYDSRL